MVSARNRLDRRAVVSALLRDRGELLVVTGLGSPSWDVHSLGDHDANFYLWGAMGSAALVGLGLAQAQPEHHVLVVTGDGEQLMALGALGTIAVARPRNLVLAVIDNGHYAETGMQPSHTSRGLDLAAVATGCGFAEARAIDDLAAMTEVRDAAHRFGDGPRLFVIRIRPENPPRSLPPRDAVQVKNRFRARLGLAHA